MVDIKKLKPVGVFMILFFSLLAIILCFTADMKIPDSYTPEHDTQYYTQSPQHMQELIEELKQSEFSRLDGIKTYDVSSSGDRVCVYIDAKNYGKVTSVLNRDFGEELFEYYQWEE
jgi:hypothetical protein